MEIVITEADINLLLAIAAMERRSYLGYYAELLDDDTSRCAYESADRLDDLAAMLAPFCVPPLAEFEQQCGDCDGDGKFNCCACRGTGLWPPTRDGVRLRLLPLAVLREAKT